MINKQGPYKLYGKSTDTKPVPEDLPGIFNGNIVFYYELDTGKAYYYDIENEDWEEAPLPEGGGGGGGGGGESGDVLASDITFLDYNGTIVASYTKEDFLALSELPANPSHQGLTAQGWNWSLADAKEYVTKYGMLNIGQMYVTSDGKTRAYITLQEGRVSPVCSLAIKGAVVIDWGDGTATDTATGTSLTTVVNTPHTYAAPGDYVISIEVTNGSAEIRNGSNWSAFIWSGVNTSNQNNKSYTNSVQKIEIGNSISIGNQAFSNCYSLASITIPDSVTSIIGNAFYYCSSLGSITIPNSVTSIGNQAFNSCSSLGSITIPNSVTSIESSAFRGCSSLGSITIPNGVTNIIGNAFNSCYSLGSITIPNSVTSIIGNAFNSCYSLGSITIPDGVTSIGNQAFSNCYSLASITIPDSVTSIGNNAFYYCSSLGFIRFESSTPPTVSASSAFQNVPTDCVIYVPTGSLSAYTSATNYPSSSTYTYVEY